MGYLTPYTIERSAWTPRLTDARERIIAGLGRLGAGLPEAVVKELARTLEVVNSYYSNSMEGNPTRIGDIFLAREGHLAKGVAERNHQLEHLAHLQTAQKMRESLKADPILFPTSVSFLQMLHREFYSALPENMRSATAISGVKVPIVPGDFRAGMVSVGLHDAIPAEQLRACMDEFSDAYQKDRVIMSDALISLAAAHHRFLWIHPFADGNGRVVRLMSEAMTLSTGHAGHSLYSISRGLARRRKEYDTHLAGADVPKWNDLDGRGNLSYRGLLEFCEFFLDVMADQIEFMGNLMDMPRLWMRLGRMLNVLRAEKALSGSESVVIQHLWRIGEIRRGEIQRIAGVERRQASKIAAHLLKEGFVQSDSPKGTLRPKINSEVMRALFPEFYE